MYGFSIYVNAPHEVCLVRRIHRDMSERGRTEESVRAQFAATARPMAELSWCRRRRARRSRWRERMRWTGRWSRY